MTVPWSRINPAQFEKLALEYAQLEYPKVKWVPTPRTRDGNRDAVASAHEWVLDRVIEYQNWLEAKYHHKGGKPTRSQLDPTLVSGLIDPRVRSILFVTNGRIPVSYLARAERAFSRSPDRFVVFKEGPDLVHWLSKHDSVSLRYFGTAINEGPAEKVSTLEISSVSLLDTSDYRRGIYKPVSHLVVGGDYLLHIVMRSSQPRKLELQLSEQFPFLVVGSAQGRRIQASAGISSHCIQVIPSQIGKFTECTVAIEGQDISASRVLPRPLTIRVDTSLRLAFVGQTKIANNLKQLIRGLRQGSNAICYIYGRGGVGKTHLLDSLEADLDLQTEFLRLAFTGNKAEDARLLCELILFLHFGPAGLNLPTLNRAFVDSSRQGRFLGTSLINGLVRGISDASEARALINDLVCNRDVRNLGTPIVDPQPAATSLVVVADDLHKLVGQESILFSRVLTDHFNGNHNSLLLISAQRDEINESVLKTTIDRSAIYSDELLTPSPNEVVESIDRFVGRRCPTGFSAALGRVSYTTLNIVNLLLDLRSKSQKLNEPQFVNTLDKWIKSVSTGKDKVILEKISKSHHLFAMLDIVFAVRVGVPLQPLIKKFGPRALDTASKRGLLSLTDDNEAVPFHDLILDEYVEMRGDCHTHDVGKFLSGCLDNGTITPDRALPTLLRCGASFEHRFLAAALEYRDSFISVGRFGPALDVSRSIVTVRERRRARGPADEESLAEAWFIYAESLNHCSIGDDAHKYFEKARGLLETKWFDPCGNGVHFEAEAELFNLRFWNLEVHRWSELREFVSKLKRTMTEEPSLRHELRFVRAYLTSLNRLMMFSHLLDKPTEKLFQENLRIADRLGKRNYYAFALIDNSKSIYHSNLKRALDQLKKGHEVSVSIGSERRRDLTSATEKSFIECRLGFTSISNLSSMTRSLLEEGLWQEYLNSQLKLVALMIADGNLKAASAQLDEFYRRRATVSDNPRRAFLIANIEAGLSFLKGDFDTARDWTLEHSKAVATLGASYQEVAKHNASACKDESRHIDIGWFIEGERQPARRFLIEPRIW